MVKYDTYCGTFNAAYHGSEFSAVEDSRVVLGVTDSSTVQLTIALRQWVVDVSGAFPRMSTAIIFELRSMVQAEAKNISDVRTLTSKHIPCIQCFAGQVRVHCLHIIDVKTKTKGFSM